MGCSTVNVKRITPMESTGQKVVYEKGEAVVMSTKNNSVAVRLLNSEFSSAQPPSFYLVVANLTTNSFNISTENISVLVKGMPVHVYTYEELMRQIEQKAANERFRTRFQAAMQGIGASNPYTETSGKFTVQGQGATYRGTYSAETYNPSAGVAAQAQIMANRDLSLSMIAANTDVRIAGLSDMLRKTTVGPKEYTSGVVKLASQGIPSESELTFMIEVGNEVHEFKFAISK